MAWLGKARFSPLVANLILGVVVVLWHVRYLLGGDYAWIYAPATLAFTFIAGWLYHRIGGSMLLALLLHVTDGLIHPQGLGLSAPRQPASGGCRLWSMWRWQRGYSLPTGAGGRRAVKMPPRLAKLF